MRAADGAGPARFGTRCLLPAPHSSLISTVSQQQTAAGLTNNQQDGAGSTRARTRILVAAEVRLAQVELAQGAVLAGRPPNMPAGRAPIHLDLLDPTAVAAEGVCVLLSDDVVRARGAVHRSAAQALIAWQEFHTESARQRGAQSAEEAPMPQPSAEPNMLARCPELKRRFRTPSSSHRMMRVSSEPETSSEPLEFQLMRLTQPPWPCRRCSCSRWTCDRQPPHERNAYVRQQPAARDREPRIRTKASSTLR